MESHFISDPTNTVGGENWLWVTNNVDRCNLLDVKLGSIISVLYVMRKQWNHSGNFAIVSVDRLCGGELLYILFVVLTEVS